jgi:hypothetical protein
MEHAPQHYGSSNRGADRCFGNLYGNPQARAVEIAVPLRRR